MMRKGLSQKSILRPTNTGLLILVALAAAAIYQIRPGSALQAPPETQDSRVELLEALARGDREVAARLFDAGVDPSWAMVDAARRSDAESLRWLFDRGAVAAGRPGARALLRALRSEDPDLVALLRAHGADLDAGDPSGVTLLMSIAGATTNEKRAYHMLSALIEEGADVNAKSLAGRTALFFAVKVDRLKVIRHLLAAGATVDSADRDGWTPLMLAARDGRGRSVVKLLEAGADPNVQSAAGWTPLMLASWYGHLAVVEELLTAGADPNLSSWAGGTALVRAVQTGRRHVVARLLAGGALASGELGGLDAAEWARLGGKGYLWQLLKGGAGR